MSDTVTVAKLEDDLPALPAGTWLIISDAGDVQHMTDAEFHEEFDLNVPDEPAPEPEPVVVEQAPQPTMHQAFGASVFERVTELLERIPQRSENAVQRPSHRPYVAGRFGGVTAREARVLASLAWMERTTGKRQFLLRELMDALPSQKRELSTGLWQLRNHKLVESSAEGEGQFVPRHWFTTPEGRVAAAQIDETPYVLAHMVAPWSRDDDEVPASPSAA